MYKFKTILWMLLINLLFSISGYDLAKKIDEKKQPKSSKSIIFGFYFKFCTFFNTSLN